MLGELNGSPSMQKRLDISKAATNVHGSIDTTRIVYAAGTVINTAGKIIHTTTTT